MEKADLKLKDVESEVRVFCHILKEFIKVKDDGGRYIVCKEYRKSHDDAPYTYLNFSMLDAKDETDAIARYREIYENGDVCGDVDSRYLVGVVYLDDSVSGYVITGLKLYATDTNIVGKNQYVVCLACGGEMGAPEYTYRDFQIIGANSEKAAVDLYNAINKCVYFKGMCMGVCMDEDFADYSIAKANIELIRDLIRQRSDLIIPAKKSDTSNSHIRYSSDIDYSKISDPIPLSREEIEDAERIASSMITPGMRKVVNKMASVIDKAK